MTSPRGTTEVGRRHIPGRTWLGAAVAPLLLTAGLLAACGPAHGTVRTRDGGRNLFFTAAAGKANDVTVTRDGEDLLVNDAGDTITPGDGCTAEDANTVRCGGITFMLLDLKDGNDEASNNTDVPAFPGEGEGGIIGGPGNDVLDGGTAEDILVGDQGTDTLNGNDGDDHLVEGLTSASTDVLDADTFNGGTGRDEVSYSAATLGVNVDVDGNADDGRPGEIDNVRIDVEDITGGDAADDLVGNAGDNTLRGAPFDGQGGADLLVGNAGNDVLFGGAGDDFLLEGLGAARTDPLDADTFNGGGGVDTASYRDATVQVQVDLDDVADDGRTGELDNVRSSVEHVEGGQGGDALTGDGDANNLFGNGGPDTIDGKAGPDFLRGDAGFDLLNGGTETDVCDLGGTGANGGSTFNCEN
jgi:Ca2+-binding RTX toxin-like protein